MFCKNCGTMLKDDARFCPECGTTTNFASMPSVAKEAEAPVNEVKEAVVCKKRKKTAGLLGIFLGALGVHRFYLGYTGTALIHIILFILGFLTLGVTALGSYVWALVDAIRIFKGKIPLDANDNELI